MFGIKRAVYGLKKYYGIEILQGKPLITGVDEQPNPEFSAIVQIFVEIVTKTPACVCNKRLSSQHIFLTIIIGIAIEPFRGCVK